MKKYIDPKRSSYSLIAFQSMYGNLVKWFLAAYFLSINKDGISEVALAKYIGVTLKTAWAVKTERR